MGLSSQTGPPEPRQTPQTPQDPPQEGLNKIVIKKKKFQQYPVANLLAVTRGRFAATGDGSPRLNDVLTSTTVYSF